MDQDNFIFVYWRDGGAGRVGVFTALTGDGYGVYAGDGCSVLSGNAVSLFPG